MSREDIDAKGRRLLVEGRLIVKTVRGELVIARCRGDSGELYDLGYDPNARQWRCTCKARGRCSHLVALQLVTVTSGHTQPRGDATHEDG